MWQPKGYNFLTGDIITSISIQTPAVAIDNNFSQTMADVFSTLDLKGKQYSPSF
jgi:hypothetical protein